MAGYNAAGLFLLKLEKLIINYLTIIYFYDRFQPFSTCTTWLRLASPCLPLATTLCSLTTRETLCLISWHVVWSSHYPQMIHLCFILPR